jgi:hypothetical protein
METTKGWQQSVKLHSLAYLAAADREDLAI